MTLTSVEVQKRTKDRRICASVQLQYREAVVVNVLVEGVSLFVYSTQVFRKATPAADGKRSREEWRLLSQRMQMLVQDAAELGTFDLFR